jgi:hypothetical protein
MTTKWAWNVEQAELSKRTYCDHAQHDGAEAEDNRGGDDHVQHVASCFETLQHEVEPRVQHYGLRDHVCPPAQVDDDDSTIALPDLEIEQDDENRMDDDAPGTCETGPEIQTPAGIKGQQTHADFDAQIPCDPEECCGCHGRGQRRDVVRRQRIVIDFEDHGVGSM